MTEWWPVVADRLVVLLPTLTSASGFVVHDGPPGNDRGSAKWAAVGWSSRDETAGAFEMPDSPVTSLRQETGTVLCEFVSWSGDDELPTHRANVTALLTDLAAAVRADQRLGVLPAGSTVTLAGTPFPARDSSGTTQRLVVAVNYFVRS